MFADSADGSTRLTLAIDAAHARASDAERALLVLVDEVDRTEAWLGSGARDTGHWLSMRYGISNWKARRWVAAAYALEDLPLISEAFSRGELGIDKVLELTRFATAATEERLIAWAQSVSCAAIRHRGDLAAKAEIDDEVEADRSRFLDWWYIDEGRRLALAAELPAAQGAVVVGAIERIAARVPQMPDEEDGSFAQARRADALVAMCSSRIAMDADPDRATVVIHAQLAGLDSGGGGCEIEGGPVIHPETVRRLLCNARAQTIAEDGAGNALGLGRLTREPSDWMMRQVRYRDRGCRFPGCETRAFTQAHHIVLWRFGGRTELDNLALICSFHHKLVHEYGWRIRREAEGELGWFRPNGVRYRAGPSLRAASSF